MNCGGRPQSSTVPSRRRNESTTVRLTGTPTSPLRTITNRWRKGVGNVLCDPYLSPETARWDGGVSGNLPGGRGRCYIYSVHRAPDDTALRSLKRSPKGVSLREVLPDIGPHRRQLSTAAVFDGPSNRRSAMTEMVKKLVSLFRNERGAEMVEWIVVVAVLAVVAL